MVRSQSLWALIVAAVLAFTSLSAGDADARGKRKKSKKAETSAKINVEALAELMGAFKFGMTRDEVIKLVAKQIAERYAEQVSATQDVYQQDKLRRERDNEVKELKKSHVEFNGKKGGWDVSLIDEHFAHKTGESMMVHWETHQGRNQRRFFFFFKGQLYKMFISLDTSSMSDEQRNFPFFRQLMENRFGPGTATDVGLSWKTKHFHVEALDKIAFYNVFCLVIADPTLGAEVLAAREQKGIPVKQRNTIIEAVAGDGDDTPSLDENANTIDNLLKN